MSKPPLPPSTAGAQPAPQLSLADQLYSGLTQSQNVPQRPQLTKQEGLVTIDLFKLIKSEVSNELYILDGVVRAINDGADVNGAIDLAGATSLHYACSNGYEKVVNILLERGANVNKITNNLTTPLYIASLKGHTKVVKSLLERKEIDVNKADSNDVTPLNAASLKGREEIVGALLKKDEIDVNKPNKDGWTPLNAASSRNYLGITKDLLLSGAGVSICQKVSRDQKNKIITNILESLKSITAEEISAIEAQQTKLNKIKENGVYFAKQIFFDSKQKNISENQERALNGALADIINSQVGFSEASLRNMLLNAKEDSKKRKGGPEEVRGEGPEEVREEKIPKTTGVAMTTATAIGSSIANKLQERSSRSV